MRNHLIRYLLSKRGRQPQYATDGQLLQFFFGVAHKTLSMLSSLSYKNDMLHSDVHRQDGIPEHAWGTTDKITHDNNNTQTAQLSLLQNFTCRLNDSNSITFKNFLLQQGQKNAIVRISQPGFGHDVSNSSYKKDNILSFSQRFLYAGNLGGRHVLKNNRHSLQWNAGYIFSRQETPDQTVIRLTVPTSALGIGDTQPAVAEPGVIYLISTIPMRHP